jgi:hypothetical protein
MRSRDGKSQRRAEEKQEYQTRERVRGKKRQMHEKVGTSRNTVFFNDLWLWRVEREAR